MAQDNTSESKSYPKRCQTCGCCCETLEKECGQFIKDNTLAEISSDVFDYHRIHGLEGLDEQFEYLSNKIGRIIKFLNVYIDDMDILSNLYTRYELVVTIENIKYVTRRYVPCINIHDLVQKYERLLELKHQNKLLRCSVIYKNNPTN